MANAVNLISFTYTDNDDSPIDIHPVKEGQSPPRNAWTLRMEPDHSVVVVQTPFTATQDSPLSLSGLHEVANETATAMQVASVWRSAHRENLSDLRQYGLVPRIITDESLQRILGVTPPVTDPSITGPFADMYGPLGVLDAVVWTVEGADLNEFGCPFLTTNGRYLNRMYRLGGDNLQWSLQHVGLSRRLDDQEPISWDDTEGVAELARRCHTPAEHHMVQIALTDSQELSSQARVFTQQSMLRDAREHFAPKSKQIRPILVKKILESVDREVTRSKEGMFGNITIEDLLSWHVTGRESERIYMCGRYSLMHRPTRLGSTTPAAPPTPAEVKATLQEIGHAVQTKLDQRNLGQAGIVHGRDDISYVVVAKDLTDMWDYAEAIGLGDETVQVLTPDRASWTDLP